MRSLGRETNKERESIAERIKKRLEPEEAAEKKKKEAEREVAIKSPVEKEWSLFFITHIDNLSSILERGILSPDLVKKLKIKYTPIYSEKIVGKREYKMVWTQGNGKRLSEFAHVYFNPRNAFLWQVLSERTSRKIIVIESTLNVSDDGICIADRNAAKYDVGFMNSYNYYKIIPKIVKETGEWQQGRRWQSGKSWAVDASKGKIMAECLVPDKIPREHFKSIHVYAHDVKAEIIPKLYELPDLDIIVKPFMFFGG